ncbi:MAG TPA: tetratricopeptide repeat protein [Planctomycetota bacterium]|nr:tetratricopeptide repeat protein [Planctomycetota bacterium]
MSPIDRPQPRLDETQRIQYAEDLIRSSMAPTRNDLAEGAALLAAVLCDENLSPAGKATAAFFLGNLLASFRRHAEAIRCFGVATRLSPSWPEAHFNYGVALQQAGQNEKAAESLRRALELLVSLPQDNPKDRFFLARIHYYLHVALSSMGDVDASLEHKEKAEDLLRQEPRDPQAQLFEKFFFRTGPDLSRLR